MTHDLKAKLTVHRDTLVITTFWPDATHPAWIPNGPGKIGCVLLDTAHHLGVSAEALAWLRKVPRSHDDLGDIDWWACDDGTKAFSWLGGPCAFRTRSEGSRHYGVFERDCVLVPNDVPEEARAMIDRRLDFPEPTPR